VTPASAATPFPAFAAAWGPRVEQALHALLPPADAPPAALHAAMRYALFPGGKRLRPLLVLLGARAVGGDPSPALPAAAALECLHTYSLVHDDLPCMDDDDLRRGRPTCHKVHGEALALLAGDALLTLAFEGVALAGPAAVQALARGAGSLGMVGGQVEDLAAEGDPQHHDLARLQWIHDHKTGALITASLLVGAHCGAGPGGAPAAVTQPLARYGDLLGRAFQIADDCLDLTGSAVELGKNPLADVARGKLTWPALLGLERSLAAAAETAAAAIAVVPEIVAAARGFRPTAGTLLDEAGVLLQDAARQAVQRRR
jgi:geranylgeranyl diphosphate synthase type II